MSIQSIQYLWYTFHICLTYPFNLCSFDHILSSLNHGSFDFVTNDNPVIAQQGEVLDLGQIGTWVVSFSHANISVPASVPGGVYSDLRQVKNGTQYILWAQSYLRRELGVRTRSTVLLLSLVCHLAQFHQNLAYVIFFIAMIVDLHLYPRRSVLGKISN